MAALDQLTSLIGLLNSTGDKTASQTTSGGSKTQQTQVSDQGVQEIVNKILSGSGGVKDVGGAARRSGLYNSTTEETLLGNLYATAANQAELARSPTVTTAAPTTVKTTQEGKSAKDLAGTLGGAFLASQALQIGSKALSPVVDSGTNYLADLVGGLFGTGDVANASGTTSSKKSIFDDIDFGVGGNFGIDTAGSSLDVAAGEGYGIDTSSLGSFGGGSTKGMGGTGLNFGFDLDSGATSVGVGGLGGLLGGALSSIVGSLGGSSGSGPGAGSNGTSGGSVICTALKRVGLLDAELHAKGEAYLASLPLEVTVGYQSWAIEIAEKIEAGDYFWIDLTLPVARSRTALLATDQTLRNYLKYPLGTITKFIGEPICGMIGRRVLAKSFVGV